MTVDDLIAGFAELGSYQGARFVWTSNIQLEEDSPFIPDLHDIRLVPSSGRSGALGQFQMLLEAAAEIVPAVDDNPGRTPVQRFIVTVFHEAASMIDPDPS